MRYRLEKQICGINLKKYAVSIRKTNMRYRLEQQMLNIITNLENLYEHNRQREKARVQTVRFITKYTIAVRVRTGPERSRKLRLPDFKTTGT
jgi:hypothetical protein